MVCEARRRGPGMTRAGPADSSPAPGRVAVISRSGRPPLPRRAWAPGHTADTVPMPLLRLACLLRSAPAFHSSACLGRIVLVRRSVSRFTRHTVSDDESMPASRCDRVQGKPAKRLSKTHRHAPITGTKPSLKEVAREPGDDQ